MSSLYPQLITMHSSDSTSHIHIKKLSKNTLGKTSLSINEGTSFKKYINLLKIEVSIHRTWLSSLFAPKLGKFIEYLLFGYLNITSLLAISFSAILLFVTFNTNLECIPVVDIVILAISWWCFSFAINYDFCLHNHFQEQN